MKKTGRLLICLLIFTLSVPVLWAQTENPPVDVSAEITALESGTLMLHVEYDFPEGFHQTRQEDFFRFEPATDAGTGAALQLGPVIYPEGQDYYGKTVLKAEILEFSPDAASAVVIKAFWQLCNEEGMCLFPQSADVDVIVDESLTAAAAGDSSGSGDGSGGFTSSIVFFLMLSFLGGLLLNVMPCVLPVLSIKALSLVKQGGEDRRQILVSSLLYTAGVIVSLLALAAVVIIIKASGEQVGWGFQFQNRGFVIVLLTIIFVFALSLFEVFTISAPVMKTGAPMKKAGGAGSHFFSGVIAVLLATPCTAPFLGTAAGFAFSQSAPVILAVFFMVGLGLSFPFIIIGFIPALVSKLPKPGAWMNTFREIMGFLLIGTSVWLVDVLRYQGDSGYLTRILIYLTAVSLAAWLYGKLSAPGASRPRRTAGAAAALVIIIASAVLLLGGSTQASAEGSAGAAAEDSEYAGWLEFSPETVYDNIGGDRPVFVAFGAKWCMTCRTNESTVIFTDEISRFFEETDAVLIHGDYTNKNEKITEWMKEFGRAGVPFYTWYPAGSFEAVLLPEVITRRTITDLR